MANALSLRRVDIALLPDNENNQGRKPSAVESLLRTSIVNGVKIFENDERLHTLGYNVAYALSREDHNLGLLLVEASPNALTPDVRAVLDVLAGQIAVAIEDYRLMQENVRLERKVAEGERLAALGQMAATVAHEVKNPLSAIKSIAQVMVEDEALKRQHARDLSLIVSETDRLSKSVTQLLSFASKRPPAAAPCSVDELLRSVSNLFRPDAEERKVALRCSEGTNASLDGVQTAAVRDALSNLVLNAIQSTPAGGFGMIETLADGNEILFCGTDRGAGIPRAVSAKICASFL